MKLETEFYVFRDEEKELFERHIQVLLEQVAAFGNMKYNQALWVEQECDCVYVKSSYGIPDCGNKINCKQIPEVLSQWVHRIAEHAFDFSDSDTDCEDDDELLNSKEYNVIIEDFDGDPALKVSFNTMSGETEEEIIFVMSEEP